MADLPAFKDLPGLKEARETQGCAWGLWDKNGVRDNLGTLYVYSLESNGLNVVMDMRCDDGWCRCGYLACCYH